MGQLGHKIGSRIPLTPLNGYGGGCAFGGGQWGTLTQAPGEGTSHPLNNPGIKMVYIILYPQPPGKGPHLLRVIDVTLTPTLLPPTSALPAAHAPFSLNCTCNFSNMLD